MSISIRPFLKILILINDILENINKHILVKINIYQQKVEFVQGFCDEVLISIVDILAFL